MGVFCRADKLIVTINPGDTGRHYLPHVHARYGKRTASVGFDGEILGGRLPPKQMKRLKKILAGHQRQLFKAWQKAIRNENFEPIELREEGPVYGIKTNKKEYDCGYTPYPRVVAFRLLDNYRMWLCFKTGEEKIYDFKPLLEREYYSPLRDKDIFESVYIDYGKTVWDIAEPSIFYQDGDFVMWNDGRIEVTGETLYDNSVHAAENTLPPKERVNAILEGMRRMHEFDRYYRLSSFVEDHLAEEEHDALYEKWNSENSSNFREMADLEMLKKARDMIRKQEKMAECA